MSNPPAAGAGKPANPRRAGPRPARVRLFSAVAWLLFPMLALPAACTGANRSPDSGQQAAQLADTAVLDDDMVLLTLYFRSGNGAEALLAPVERLAPVGEDLPRLALEELLRGPTEDDGRALDRPLPADTVLMAFSVADGTAFVTLSRNVVTDARTVGNAPRQEALALAALANTMTEFPSIHRVRLTVDGLTDPTDFWGGWGLPDTLVRDETLIAPANGKDGLPDLSRFRRTAQSAGTPDAAQARVASVRVRDRITYVRVVAELHDATDTSLPAAAAPPVRARTSTDGLVLDLTNVAGGADLEAPDQPLESPFGALQFDTGPTEHSLRITVPLEADRDFYLHTMSGPTRIVLDVKK